MIGASIGIAIGAPFNDAEAVVESGDGAITTDSTVSAVGTGISAADGAVSTGSTLSAVGTGIAQVDGAVSTDSTLAAVGTGIAQADGAVSTDSTLSAVGSEVIPADGAISTDSTLGAIGSEVRPSVGAITTNSVLAATGSRTFLPITDTDKLQKPVDYALAGKQLIKDGYREFDIRPMDLINATIASRTQPVRLGGGKPSFTVKTGTRGFD